MISTVRGSVLGALTIACITSFAGLAAASDDAGRDQHAAKDCVRGAYKDYYLQGQGGDPPAGYTGRVFKLSQNYPTALPPMEKYPWLKIDFKNGGPVDPEAYLRALLAYGLEGNVDVDFYVEDNKARSWYGIPWMDWNTEVSADWPGTDGREFPWLHPRVRHLRDDAQRLPDRIRRHLVGRVFSTIAPASPSGRSIATPTIRALARSTPIRRRSTRCRTAPSS